MDRLSGNPLPPGFRMPGEWEPHEATWIAWPHEKTDWPGKFAPIPWVYVEIARLLAKSERVEILVNDGAGEAVRLAARHRADLRA
jgi:agmatine deiminase